MALYFYLLSCDYTKTNSHKRTTQFRLHDMQFHDAWGILPFESSSQKFLQVTVVTFSLDTQKNSVQGECISIEATCLAFCCPVQVEAEQFIHIRFHEANIYTPICTYFPSSGSLGL